MLHSYKPYLSNKFDVIYFIVLRFGQYDFISRINQGDIQINLKTILNPDNLPFEEAYLPIIKRFHEEEYRFWEGTMNKKGEGLAQIEELLLLLHEERLGSINTPLTDAEAQANFHRLNSEPSLPILTFDLLERGPNARPRIHLNNPNDDEHTRKAKTHQQLIIDYISSMRADVQKSIILNGPPGAGKPHFLNSISYLGKSYLANLIAKMLFARGAEIIIATCVASHRAQDLHGIHLHELFKLGKHHNSILTHHLKPRNSETLKIL